MTYSRFTPLLISLSLFFIAFNVLEASLPSLVSKLCPVQMKGAAMGIYNTAQSIGLFCGGLMGSLAYAYLDLVGLALFIAIVLFPWIYSAYQMKTPPAVRTIIMPFSWQSQNHDKINAFSQALLAIPGVYQVYIFEEAHEIHLKVMQDGHDEQALQSLLNHESFCS
jgi:hypothetical protein